MGSLKISPKVEPLIPTPNPAKAAVLRNFLRLFDRFIIKYFKSLQKGTFIIRIKYRKFFKLSHRQQQCIIVINTGNNILRFSRSN
jgi:hypothetical protein